MRTLAALLATILLSPKPANTTATYLNRPFGETNALLSPDGKHALWGDYQNVQLEIEDTETHSVRSVAHMTVQTLSLVWSPDSTHFVVNDRPDSSEEDAYIFDIATLNRIRLRDRLTAALPKMSRYYLLGTLTHGRQVDHSFLHVLRWIDDQHVELQLWGHTDGRFAHNNADGHLYPAQSFDLRFRVGLDGSVETLSERISPL